MNIILLLQIKNKKFNYANLFSKIIEKSIIFEKRNSDTLFKLKGNLRTLLGNAFRRNGFSKSGRAQEILDCSFEELKIYLESKLESWMTWKNYGKYNGELNYGWDIDHIIPLTNATNEAEMIKLNHYKNLQPLCSFKNRVIKRDK